jgi:hypothetical protein
MKKSKYIGSNPNEKGLEMWFEYKGIKYSVIRAFTYPVPEAKQHKEAKEIIEKALRRKDVKGTETAKEAMEKFFKEIS